MNAAVATEISKTHASPRATAVGATEGSALAPLTPGL